MTVQEGDGEAATGYRLSQVSMHRVPPFPFRLVFVVIFILLKASAVVSAGIERMKRRKSKLRFMN
jgi:hypothetical protein